MVPRLRCFHTFLIVTAASILCLFITSVVSTEIDSPPPSTTNDPHLPLAPYHESVLMLDGDPARPVALEVTLLTPYGPGPFPLAVINHGATKTSANNRGERYRLTLAAFYFLSRGYAVALPMMRGFAESGGDLVEEGCDLAQIAALNGRDISAVTKAISQQQDIDRTRIVVAGQSFGAWNTLGLGIAPPPGVHGMISFNATMRPSDCHDQDRSLVAAAGKLGARASVPSLWFYGDNDTLMPVAVWRDVFNQYTRSGGKADLVDVGQFKDDSHQLLSHNDSIPLWAPKIDAFLERIGMPSAPLYPDFLPHPAPLATHWAQLSDTSAIPFLHVKGLAAYQAFMGAPKPRAFAIASNGSFGVSGGGYDPIGRALLGCAKYAVGCKLYAVDDNVVWSPPPRGTQTQVP
jgi:dienelactone hydrolase